MPFEKLGADKYRGPSGKVFNRKQVAMYYSRGGSFPGQASMGADFPKSPGHFSPTAPGAMGKPDLVPS